MKILIKIISFLSLLRYRICFGKRLKVGKNVIANFRLKIRGPGSIEIENNVNLWSFEEKTQLHTYSAQAHIYIGKDTRMNGANIQARKEVSIGETCLIGSAIIIDNDFHHIDPKRRFDKMDIPTKAIHIGKNVWLCGQSAILKGVTIGDNSVVGFRAVVAKDVPSNVVVVGNPAHIVKENI